MRSRDLKGRLGSVTRNRRRALLCIACTAVLSVGVGSPADATPTFGVTTHATEKTFFLCRNDPVRIFGGVAPASRTGKVVLQQFYGGAWHRRSDAESLLTRKSRYDIFVYPRRAGKKKFRPVWLHHGLRTAGPRVIVTELDTITRGCAVP